MVTIDERVFGPRLLMFSLVVLSLTALGGTPVAATGPQRLNQKKLAILEKRAGDLDTDALVVMHGGKIVLDKWFDGRARKIESMSVTKSIVALAIGRLVALKKIPSLDEPIYTWHPEWRQGQKKNVTIRHLLTQTSGLQADRMTSEIYESPDFVQLALCAELISPPGAEFFYNNKATNLLPALVQRISGKRIDLFLADELFKPLGIVDFDWVLDPAGNALGMSGLKIYPKDLASLGQLMLNRGKWRGRQLLTPSFVDELTQPTERNPNYGLLWWLETETTREIDDATLAAWKLDGAPAEFVTAMTPLRGQKLRGKTFYAAVETALKDLGGLETWHDNTWRKKRSGGKILDRRVLLFRADGWQGQHVVVIPDKDLVVVRMREPSEGNSPEENKKYSFPELIALSGQLVQ